MTDPENPALFVPDAPAADGPAPKAELTPQEVLDLLAAGKPVVNARVRRLKLRGEFAGPVHFRHCVLTQPEFNGVTFKADVLFAGCTLDRPSFSKPTVCEKGLDLSGSTVNKATVTRVTVKGKFTAAHTTWTGKLAFTDCRFEDKASFWEAKFVAWVDFKGCVFGAEADFRSCHAQEGFVLTKSEFRGDFLFRGSAVEKKFQADGSRFDALLDLGKSKLKDFAYLEAISQGPNMKFAFLNALADRVLVRPEQVEGRLASEEGGKHEAAMSEYGLLKQCYQKHHRYDHEDWAFYRFKVNQRKGAAWSWGRPWTAWRRFSNWLFLDLGCGYGTDPVRAVRMALVIILSFAVLYGAGVEEFHAEKKPFPDAGLTDASNRVMIGLTTSVSVFTSGMGGIREIAKGWMNVPVMVESVMGTLLFGLFIVAFSRKVIR